MKNRLNINNNFATAAPWSHDLRVPVRAAAPAPSADRWDATSPLAKPLASSAASLLAAAPVTALAPTVSAALAAAACLNIIARRSAERFNIALTSFNMMNFRRSRVLGGWFRSEKMLNC